LGVAVKNFADELFECLLDKNIHTYSRDNPEVVKCEIEIEKRRTDKNIQKHNVVDGLKESQQKNIRIDNHDIEAKLQGLAEVSGVPVDTLRHDEAGVTRQLRTDAVDYVSLLQEHSDLGAYMAKPENADISHDGATWGAIAFSLLAALLILWSAWKGIKKITAIALNKKTTVLQRIGMSMVAFVGPPMFVIAVILDASTSHYSWHFDEFVNHVFSDKDDFEYKLAWHGMIITIIGIWIAFIHQYTTEKLICWIINGPVDK
jgi:hypothetical protein